MGVSSDTKGRLSELLRGREDEIIKQWCAVAAPRLRGRLTVGELSRQVTDIFNAVLGLLESPGDATLSGAEAGHVRAVLSELSRNCARQGFSPTETATLVFGIKEPLVGISDFAEFSSLVDEMGLFTFEIYTKAREEVINDQTEQLLELSTPVVKLWEGVVAVPLVGTLDSARSQVVMEKLLQTLVDTGSGYAIIDITGVPAVDTQVAQHILKTVVAARLMGAECIISGIRPQIAQTVVALGIEFGDIATKATLADALVHTLRGSGYEISRRAARRES